MKETYEHYGNIDEDNNPDIPGDGSWMYGNGRGGSAEARQGWPDDLQQFEYEEEEEA